MRTMQKKRPPDPQTRMVDKLLNEKVGRPRDGKVGAPAGAAAGSEQQRREQEEKAALLGLRIQQLALEKEHAEQERDKHASLADFGQQEFLAAEKTAKQQSDEIVILKQKQEEIEWRTRNAREEFEQDETRLRQTLESLEEQLADLRASRSSHHTEEAVSFAADDVKRAKEQLLKERRERTALEKELADLAALKRQETDGVRDKLSSLQNRCRREANERDSTISDLRQQIHEMALSLTRKEAKIHELRAVLEDERKKRGAAQPLSRAHKEIAAQVERMKELAEEREMEAIGLQDRLDVCESALHDQKGELKSALSFLSAMREQATSIQRRPPSARSAAPKSEEPPSTQDTSEDTAPPA